MSASAASFRCSKSFSGYPCSHRQWRHPGHCRFVHGYSRSFTFWFQASELDAHGFVVDFSSLRPLQQQLADQFDHTFLANADDPLLDTWRQLHDLGALDLRVMDNVGMEASAQLVWGWANSLLWERDRGRSCCWRVEARENERNAAQYLAVPSWFRDRSAATGDAESGASLAGFGTVDPAVASTPQPCEATPSDEIWEAP